MKLEDDIRAALHQRAATHEVVVPPVEDLIAQPYGAPAPQSGRRLVVGVAAALLVVALGAAAVALTRDEPDDPRPPAATVTEPTAGTHGAILTAFGPPIDGSELLFEPPEPIDPDAAGPLVVLDEIDGSRTAVVAFTPDTGRSSFDSLPLDEGTTLEVGGRPAVLHPIDDRFGLRLALEVDRGEGQRLFVAGRDLDAATLEDLAVAALVAVDPLADWWPADRWTATYTGPDRNPFSHGVGDERRLAYELDGRSLAVIFQGGAADPGDYAWFIDGTVAEGSDGRRVVRWTAEGAETRSVAAWSDAGGMVVVEADTTEDLDAGIAAVQMVDRSTWDAERASATAPGTFYQSADASATTMATTTTTG